MRIGIQTKIITCIVTSLIVTALGTLIIADRIVAAGFKEQTLNTGEIIARFLSEETEDHGVFTGQTTQFDLLLYRIIQKNNKILYIFLIGQKGNIITSTVPFNYASQISKSFPMPKGADKNLSHFYLNNEVIKGGVYDVSYNILKSQLGVIHIGFSDVELRTTLDKFNQRFLLVMLTICLGAILLSSYIIKKITTPLKYLVQNMEEIRQGKLETKVLKLPQDEIGLLGHTFFNMVADLKAYRKQLKDSNSMLEQRFEERTQKLQDTMQELKNSQQQLILSGQLTAVGQLAAGVSHEINNPLGGILGYSQFIIEKGRRKNGLMNLTPVEFKTIETYLGYIEREAQRCKNIVANLLKFSNESVKNDFSSLAINQVLEDTLNLTRHQLEINHIDLTTDFAPDLPVISGKTYQLQQVFTNLITNAQQAMKDGGKLSISTKLKSNEHIEIIFADTGYGIPEENLGKIFEPFFTTKSPGEGPGLGLSVSYGIIKAHRGEIQVESELEKGSTFHIILPVNTNT